MNISKIIQFLKIDIWRIRKKELSRSKSFFIKQLRIFILASRGFVEDNCQLRASALTYYSLLSIVPVFAMVFGIAKGFGFEKMLQGVLLKSLEGQEQIVTQVMGFARALLENVKGGLIAGIGVVILFYTIIKILSHIESAFNRIWGITNSRSIGRRISDYLSIMLICPVLFLMSSAATVIISSGVKLVVQKISLLEAVSPVFFFMLKFLPYCIIWILFTFLYVSIPNTRVHYKSGLLAGIIAGTMYQVFQRAYIFFQIGVAKYNAVYGSFAALPLFFIWLQISWLIVLIGAEISFAHQNADTYEFEQDSLAVSHSFKTLLSLRTVHLLISHFSSGKMGLTASQIASKLEIPIRLVHRILHKLVASRIVSEIKADEYTDVAYQPARDPDTMTIKYVIDALEQYGSDDIPVAQSSELQRLSSGLKSFSDLVEKSPANKRLKEI
ncbi:MAG: YihY/virulence factor BrkB family protein [Thermodesulfobacteriota bacterium]|nr:YihY/virulence factor BrkB family protein [Thermodesulfobacteriota bacterium]